MDALYELIALYESMGIVADLLELAIAVISIVSLWKVFTKAGEGGWKILIPIYNGYIQYKIAGCRGRYWAAFLLTCAASVLAVIAGISMAGAISAEVGIISLLAAGVLFLIVGIIGITYTFKFARAFGRGFFFGLGLLFLPFIFLAIIAFNGNIVYVGNVNTR